jgi:hypothetical protein
MINSWCFAARADLRWCFAMGSDRLFVFSNKILPALVFYGKIQLPIAVSRRVFGPCCPLQFFDEFLARVEAFGKFSFGVCFLFGLAHFLVHFFF